MKSTFNRNKKAFDVWMSAVVDIGASCIPNFTKQQIKELLEHQCNTVDKGSQNKRQGKKRQKSKGLN